MIFTHEALALFPFSHSKQASFFAFEGKRVFGRATGAAPENKPAETKPVTPSQVNDQQKQNPENSDIKTALEALNKAKIPNVNIDIQTHETHIKEAEDKVNKALGGAPNKQLTEKFSEVKKQLNGAKITETHLNDLNALVTSLETQVKEKSKPIEPAKLEGTGKTPEITTGLLTVATANSFFEKETGSFNKKAFDTAMIEVKQATSAPALETHIKNFEAQIKTAGENGKKITSLEVTQFNNVISAWQNPTEWAKKTGMTEAEIKDPNKYQDLKLAVDSISANAKQISTDTEMAKKVGAKHKVLSMFFGGPENVVRLINSNPLFKMIAEFLGLMPKDENGETQNPRNKVFEQNRESFMRTYGEEFKRNVFNKDFQASGTILAENGIKAQDFKTISEIKDEKEQLSQKMLFDVSYRWKGRIGKIESFQTEGKTEGKIVLQTNTATDALALSHFYGSSGKQDLPSFSLDSLGDMTKLISNKKEDKKEAEPTAKNVANMAEKISQQNSEDFGTAKTELPKNLSAMVTDGRKVTITWNSKDPFSFGRKK